MGLSSALGALLLAAFALPLTSQAQPGGPALSARAAPALDMQGDWIAVVTEDWKFRMVTPNKGEYAGIPLNAAGRRVADAWEPATSDSCRIYGAANIMRVPGRLRIGWEDEDTLRIDTDAGRQTRMLHFDSATSPASVPSSLQGYSAAEWRYAVNESAADAVPNHGGLKVVTTRLAPGYLRGNGVPYGERAMMTEYFNVFDAPNGDQWLVVTTIVEDPEFLSRPFYTSSHFKRLRDDSGWNPTDC